MSKKDFHLSKQLFITFSVSLVLFVTGLVWSGLCDFKADYWIAIEFNKISDRYHPTYGEVASGNLYAKVYHWGNMINKVTQGDPNHIDAWIYGGVAWYDNRQDNQKYAGAPETTAIDYGMVAALGGDNESESQELADPNDFVDPEFFISHYTHKEIDPDDVEHYWAGAYTTTYFLKLGRTESNQDKVTIKRWAPTGTEYNKNYTRKPSSGWYTLKMPGCP